MQLWVPACGGSGANCLLNASPYRPARLWLQEAIQKEKERSIKLVAQEKGWLMDKAANYHAAFMSVESRARHDGNHAYEEPPVIGLTWKVGPSASVGDSDQPSTPTPLNFSRKGEPFLDDFTKHVCRKLDARVKGFRDMKKHDIMKVFGPEIGRRLHKLQLKLGAKLSKIKSTLTGKEDEQPVDEDTIAVDYSGTLSTWSFLKGSRLTPSDVQTLATYIKNEPIIVKMDCGTYETTDRVISDRADLPKTISAVELALVMKSLRHEEVPLVFRFWSYIKLHVFHMKTATTASANELLKAKRAIALFTRDKHHTGTMDFEEFVSMMLCRADTTKEQEQQEAFRMLCGGKTFAGDYSKLNCFQRTKNGLEPAVHPIDAETEAKWREPPSTLTTHGQKKTMDEDFFKNQDDFPCFPDGHWIAQKIEKKEKGAQRHPVPGGIRTRFRKEEEFLPSLDVVKYGRFPVKHLIAAPPGPQPPYKDRNNPGSQYQPGYLRTRKAHYFQYYDSMLKERLSLLDHDDNEYVTFEELRTVLEDAHKARWTGPEGNPEGTDSTCSKGDDSEDQAAGSSPVQSAPAPDCPEVAFEHRNGMPVWYAPPTGTNNRPVITLNDALDEDYTLAR
jgi:Ca2+-binding EF-hand superfamily protein